MSLKIMSLTVSPIISGQLMRTPTASVNNTNFALSGSQFKTVIDDFSTPSMQQGNPGFFSSLSIESINSSDVMDTYSRLSRVTANFLQSESWLTSDCKALGGFF